VSVIHSLPSYNKHGKFDKIPPKAAILLSAVIISRQGNTSITKSLDTNLQVVTRGQLQLVLNQLQSDNIVQDERLNNIGSIKVKMPLIKQFNKIKSKLKGFLI